MKTSGNTVLITGGSTGIGLAVAQAFIAAGNTVIVCGRDQNRLDKAKKIVPGITTIQCNITRDDDLANLVKKVEIDIPQLNIVINNAAMMHVCDFVENNGGLESTQDEINTNFLAPVKLTTLLLPVLQRQPAAAIIIVSSGLAYVPVAKVTVYSATKAALHAFSRALRHRLQMSTIKVFELLPPLVDTDLSQHLHMPKIQPEQVAQALISALKRDRYEVRVGMVKLLYVANQLMPSLAERMLNKAFLN